ncbi:hypothetical protein COCON_G00129990 [Conger conger]|uniref:Uncharacterized protein n=1 Tax=Conger conger TaxID=82655 RepID=A0A9Q1DDL9_CONCO|nr:hypothetical protein COCON_G00129990 [Conger conger]
MNVSELVGALPGPLLSRLSLSALKRASLRSVDQLEGREWTRAQAVFLVKKILGKRLRPQDIRKLGSALQGVTCEMIDSTNHTEVFPLVEALEQSKSRLSRTQMRCAARKLFESLEKKRASYFANITGQELQAIPTTMLLYLPTERIAGLPDSVCSSFLEKMSRADLPLLPLNSAPRVALIEKALGCLKRNLSSLTPDDIASLGGLVLELQPWQLAALSRPALNATLLALAQGRQMHPHLQGPIRKHLQDLYGKPSDWSLDTMTLLGPLLLWVNDYSTFRSLPYKPWLRGALMDLLDSRPPLTIPQPPEFNTEPDLSGLRWKIFSLAITPGNAKSSRTNHDPIEPRSPSLENVVDVGEGNVFWTPDQLEQMSAETFTEGVSDLGVVRSYTPLQLEVLRNKTIQVWGEAGSLSEDQVLQLACITQGFSPAELQEMGITSLDSLELLSPCGWNLDQSEVVLQGFLGGNNLTIGELGAVEVVGLGQFICGMSPQEVEELNNDTFREAVGALGAVRCSQEVTEKLKDRAVLLFGEVENWDQAEVNVLGNIIAGLQASELQSLDPSVFSFISQTAIPLILPDRLAALSVAQLLAMGPDNAAMVTPAQRKALGRLQLDALDKALGLEYLRSYISATTPPVNPLSPIPHKSAEQTAGVRLKPPAGLDRGRGEISPRNTDTGPLIG